MTQADFELLCRVLPEPMLLVSRAGVILAANEAVAKLLKREPSALRQTAFTDFVADPREQAVSLLAMFARSGQFMPGSLSFRTHASGIVKCRIEGALLQLGDELALVLRLQPEQDAIRHFRSLTERIAHLNREIFDRKQAARASALLGAIVDSSDDAIISKDLNGVIMSWNKGAERLFGYTAGEVIGQPITIIIPPERLDEEPKILELLKRGERIDHFETIRVRKDGARLVISLTISPVRDQEGRIVGASKIARDVTGRVRQEKALKDANEALRRANADLEQFAYSASHDLQEPLRMVASYSELLKKRFSGRLGETGEEYISFAVEGAQRMERLLSDLRTYTHVSITEHRPAQEIDAGAVFEKTLLNLNVAIKESGAAITCTPLPRIRLYEFQLEQIFQNLIANAIRYRRSEPPRIHVAAAADAGTWVFSVQDNGIGIEAKYKEQIFGIFKRLHNASEYPGTGMGLAICQRIVERAGGRIWVESTPGRGSTFYFTIGRGESSGGRAEPESLLDPSDRRQPSGRGTGA